MSNSAFMYASCIHKISSIYCLASFKFIDIIVIDLESPQFLLNYVAFQFRWPKELGKCRWALEGIKLRNSMLVLHSGLGKP